MPWNLRARRVNTGEIRQRVACNIYEPDTWVAKINQRQQLVFLKPYLTVKYDFFFRNAIKRLFLYYEQTNAKSALFDSVYENKLDNNASNILQTSRGFNTYKFIFMTT